MTINSYSPDLIWFSVCVTVAWMAYQLGHNAAIAQDKLTRLRNLRQRQRLATHVYHEEYEARRKR